MHTFECQKFALAQSWMSSLVTNYIKVSNPLRGCALVLLKCIIYLYCSKTSNISGFFFQVISMMKNMTEPEIEYLRASRKKKDKLLAAGAKAP
jgi:hypothetical protein